MTPAVQCSKWLWLLCLMTKKRLNLALDLLSLPTKADKTVAGRRVIIFKLLDYQATAKKHLLV